MASRSQSSTTHHVRAMLIIRPPAPAAAIAVTSVLHHTSDDERLRIGVADRLLQLQVASTAQVALAGCRVRGEEHGRRG